MDAGLRAGREPFVRTPELAPVHVYMGAMSGGRGMECGVRVLLTVKSTWGKGGVCNHVLLTLASELKEPKQFLNRSCTTAASNLRKFRIT